MPVQFLVIKTLNVFLYHCYLVHVFLKVNFLNKLEVFDAKPVVLHEFLKHKPDLLSELEFLYVLVLFLLFNVVILISLSLFLFASSVRL